MSAKGTTLVMTGSPMWRCRYRLWKWQKLLPLKKSRAIRQLVFVLRPRQRSRQSLLMLGDLMRFLGQYVVLTYRLGLRMCRQATRLDVREKLPVLWLGWWLLCSVSMPRMLDLRSRVMQVLMLVPAEFR